MRYLNLTNLFLKDLDTNNIPYILEDNKGLIFGNDFGSTVSKYKFMPEKNDSSTKSGILVNLILKFYD